MKSKILVALFMLYLSKSSAQVIAFPDRHNTNTQDSWVSCLQSANPNSSRGLSHWIKYDLGETYALQQSTIWNYNAVRPVNIGMKDIVIDYSIDGINWIEWGRYYLPNATSSGFYEGVDGPNFGGLIARYILITGLSNYGGSCYGLSEIRINGSPANTSSAENLLEDLNVTVSPNPFSTSFNINVASHKGPLNVQLRDLSGKIVIQTVMNSNQAILLTDAIPSGAYTLSLNNAQGVKTLPIIKIE
jgi:hypothetical protein